MALSFLHLSFSSIYFYSNFLFHLKGILSTVMFAFNVKVLYYKNIYLKISSLGAAIDINLAFHLVSKFDPPNIVVHRPGNLLLLTLTLN